MSEDETENTPDAKIIRQSGFGSRDGEGSTRRVATLPHLIAKSRRPDRPPPEGADSSLEEDTFNPTDDLFDQDLDDDFFDDLFSEK